MCPPVILALAAVRLPHVRPVQAPAREWYTGVLTGKGSSFGGSLARTEATGYGLCYFAKEMLADAGKSFEGQRVVISGSGNVATYANQKATQLGGKVIAMSDSNGYIVDENGIDYKVIKGDQRGQARPHQDLSDYVPTASTSRAARVSGPSPAISPLPCATQNELRLDGAKGSGCQWLLFRSRGCQYAFHP